MNCEPAGSPHEACGPYLVNDRGVISRCQFGGNGGLHVEAFAENNRRHVPLL
jgi:hypothetical protein